MSTPSKSTKVSGTAKAASPYIASKAKKAKTRILDNILLLVVSANTFTILPYLCLKLGVSPSISIILKIKFFN